MEYTTWKIVSTNIVKTVNDHLSHVSIYSEAKAFNKKSG